MTNGIWFAAQDGRVKKLGVQLGSNFTIGSIALIGKWLCEQIVSVLNPLW